MRNTIYRGLGALLATITLASASAMTALAQPDVAPSGDIGTQVVGGGQARQLYPGLAALEYDSDSPPRDDHQTCTAVLLETGKPGWSEWGATAAHCATERPAASTAASRLFGPPVWVPVKERKFQLRAGSLDRTQVPPLPIAQFVVNPWWQWIPGGPDPVDPTPAVDVVLFRLAAPIQVRGAMVASAEPRLGTPIRAVGWGRTSNNSAATPTIANELRTRIVLSQDCAGGDISRHDLCTDNPDGSGMCNADSGGPAYWQVNGRWQAAGLVSRGATAECGGSPDVHTGLAYLRPWINAVTQGTVRTDLPLTSEQGGEIAHPSIRFTTTDKVQLQDRIPVR